MHRRDFIATTSAAVCGTVVAGCSHLATAESEPIIDIHQHTDYAGRTDAELIAHQRTMGVTHSILLPAGRWFGLEAGIGPNANACRLARKHPRQFSFFSNEVPYVGDARERIIEYLEHGAIGIGEQKFEIDSDSAEFQRIADIAQEYNVPMLIHFQFGKYNTGFDRFHKILEKYPRVNFIGHAQTWWANVDRNHTKQEVLYPKGPITPGGITDRLLADYPNMYGDTSAGSGLNALTRDPEFTKGFLARHQDKLLFGSDCNDKVGRGSACQGAQILEAIRKYAPDKEAVRKILYHNAKRVMRMA
jgi:uncharacterized protein